MDFHFRLVLQCIGGGEFEEMDRETFVIGFDLTTTGERSYSHWLHESSFFEPMEGLSVFLENDGADLSEGDVVEVVGIGRLEGRFDYFGEYDEDCEVIESIQQIVPKANVMAEPEPILLMGRTTTPAPAGNPTAEAGNP